MSDTVSQKENATRNPSGGANMQSIFPASGDVDAANPQDSIDPQLKALEDILVSAIRKARNEVNTGWADIGATLNDIDDERIGRCKEDIDTLLVFAGLFSAVLTAFLIESYQLLLPDPTDNITQLLTRIAVQTSGYTIVGSFINATVSVPPPPPFEPLSSALRINRLWFVSLVLSLVTASFGILIKQWLREYKAVDPQFANLRTRLRIRQYRYPGLLKWKVFELAAILPLLLQLSLGLFLLGLCFFTWSVHPSIGRSTTVLVGGWIFFFAMAALFPAVFSDCPYKISLFLPVLKSIRSTISRIWRLKPRQRAWRWTIACSHAIVSLLGAALFLSSGFRFERTLRRLLNRGDDALDAAYKSQSTEVPLLEEEQVAKDEQKDVAMLVAVDEVLLDDELLGATMRTVIAQNQFSPSDAIPFVIKALHHRLPQLQATANGDYKVSDLSSLPARAWQAVVDIISDAFERQLKEGPPVTPMPWIHDAFAVLLSRGTHPLPLTRGGLSVLFSGGRPLPHSLGPKPLAGLAFAHLWPFFNQVLPSGFTQNILKTLFYVHAGQHCDQHCSHASYAEQAEHHLPSVDDQPFIRDLVIQDLVSRCKKKGSIILADIDEMLSHVFVWAQNTAQFGNTSELIGQFLNVFDKWDRNIVEKVRLPLLVMKLVQHFMASDSLLPAHHVADGRSILRIFSIIFRTYATGELDSLPEVLQIDVLHLCSQSINVCKVMGADVEAVRAHDEEWALLFPWVADALRKYFDLSGTNPERSQATKRILAWDFRYVFREPLSTEAALLVQYLKDSVEALHLFILPSQTYSEPKLEGATCQRLASDITFQRRTTEIMSSNGLLVDITDRAEGQGPSSSSGSTIPVNSG